MAATDDREERSHRLIEVRELIRRLRPLRVLPARLPDLFPVGPGNGLTVGTHRVHGPGAVRRTGRGGPAPNISTAAFRAWRVSVPARQVCVTAR